MIKFEEHDGMLFKMLDKPVPLTDDAELPVLVRMIQDDTMLGKANKRRSHPDTLAQKIICINLTDDGLFLDGNYAYRYEIIGIPVAEGSAEWALYQMMQGRKVCCSNVAYNALSMGSTTNIGSYHIGDPIHGGYYCTVDTFLLESVKTGWQIYKEQKPLLAYAKVGDLVKLRNGSYSQIAIDINDVTIVTQSQNGSVCEYDINGNHGDINGWHIDRVISPSEHIITIGCLSGTVEPVSINGIHIWFHLIGVDDKTIATIRISSLDTQTRELVESLIKGQEEE